MSNQFGFLSDDTFAEKMDTMNQFLAAIATGQGGSLKPTSWSDVQALVRKGLASKVFAVGDQLTCQRGSTTLVWDIIGFDIDTPADKQFTHSMTLQLLVATRLDLVTGTNFIRDAVVIAFIANETISIVENAGLMGINIPPAITSAIEVLKKKSDSEDNTDQ